MMSGSSDDSSTAIPNIVSIDENGVDLFAKLGGLDELLANEKLTKRDEVRAANYFPLKPKYLRFQNIG